jgi:hypothetical protein
MRMPSKSGKVSRTTRVSCQSRKNMIANMPMKVSKFEAAVSADSAKTSFKVLVSLTILVMCSPERDLLWKERESRWRWAKSTLRRV